MLRGGSWWDEPGFYGSAYRNWDDPGIHLVILGCRVLLCPDDQGSRPGPNPLPRTPGTSLQPDAPSPPGARPAALGLVRVLAGQPSGTPDQLASWPGTSGRRRKLL